MEEILLATNPNYSIKQYINDIQEKTDESKLRISTFLKNRFLQRYIYPTYCNKENGFNIMANCCLLIETLESFYSGRAKTPPKEGVDTFNKFFSRFEDFEDFTKNGMSKTFYENIRCAILHQGETTKGWKIRRDQNTVLNLKDKIIDACHFRDLLEKAVTYYCDSLLNLPNTSNEWIMLEKKMKSILKNCE